MTKWTEDNIVGELEKAVEEIGHFPVKNELDKIKKFGLNYAIIKYGGFNYFREKLGYKIIKQSSGYWTEENIIKELKQVIEEIGYFPTGNKLRQMKRYNLESAIYRNGGINYYREKMGHEITKNYNGYWTEEKIINKLEEIINDIGYFPLQKELISINTMGLLASIHRTGGLDYFRKKLGYEPIYKPNGYWTGENIIKELKEVIEEIGYFPSHTELRKIGRNDLSRAIGINSSINNIKIKMGYKITHQDKGYWTEENTINELKMIIEEIKFFPTQTELIKIGRNDLLYPIQKNGGFPHFKELLGIPVSIQEKHTSELMSYIGKRGKASEDIIYKIISEYCKTNDLPLPDLNVKLAKGNVLEFVCGIGKNIGIDVTNTKASKNTAKRTISNKWKKKDYHLYLDELWVVVFTDVLLSEDYDELNSNSPENVKVFSIEGFLKELDFSADQHMKNKIDKFEACSFHNKEKMKGLNT